MTERTERPPPVLSPSPRANEREARLREEVRAFCRELDLPSRYTVLDRKPEFPQREWGALARRGYLGLRVPPELGGKGATLVDEASVIEELAFGGGSAFAKLALQPDFCSPLLHGSPELIDRWYRPLLRGELLVGNHISEPDAGSDVAAISMRAERQGDDYVLDGTKAGIAFASDAQAALVYARTGPEPGARGITAFLVPQDLRGIRAEVEEDLGERWMRRGAVHYDHVKVPSSQVVGKPGEGFLYLMEELTPERALLGLLYLAVARASWEETRSYVAQRRAFGRPIGSFQAVSFPLVEDLSRLDSTRLYAWRTIERLSLGEKVDAEAALLKWLANTTALEALDHAMQFHGGDGYSARWPHEQRWRDVRSGTTAHGSNEVLKLVAARELLALPRKD